MDSAPLVAIYARVSTADQDCSLQIAEMKRYCAARGWTVNHIYQEKLSGTTDKRPQLQKLMMEARERAFDIVLVWKLDRFARSIKSLVTNVQELTELDVQFVSLKDQIDMTTSAGRLMTHILASFAEFEASLIKERVVAGLANAKRKGIRLGRPNQIDQKRVRELREQGKSFQEIATALGCSKAGVFKAVKAVGI